MGVSLRALRLNLGTAAPQAVRSALEKLRRCRERDDNDEPPCTGDELGTPAELASLTAFAQRVRPSLRLPGGIGFTGPFTAADALAVTPLLPSIVALRVGATDRLEGTGTVVGARAVLTNRHVAAKLGSAAEAVFAADSRSTAAVMRVVGVVESHASADVVILELEADAPVAPARVSRRGPRAAGRRCAVIGYPAEDPNVPAWARLILGGVYGVKRVAPGKMLSRAGIDCKHDASTFVGNSGSPIVELSRAIVVAVHVASTGPTGDNAALSTSALTSFSSIERWV